MGSKITSQHSGYWAFDLNESKFTIYSAQAMEERHEFHYRFEKYRLYPHLHLFSLVQGALYSAIMDGV